MKLQVFFKRCQISASKLTSYLSIDAYYLWYTCLEKLKKVSYRYQLNFVVWTGVILTIEGDASYEVDVNSIEQKHLEGICTSLDI